MGGPYSDQEVIQVGRSADGPGVEWPVQYVRLADDGDGDGDTGGTEGTTREELLP